ncbi:MULTISPECIES: hypothetical protein [unclassified Sphingomonas]|uniref:hypothetical protein n=1 Tax=unclassified Sphingomonas TaxID=196159 RepID=UPI0006FC931B|nr:MULTISPECIES: hypothetical protein [unclassified Sphingomonas]KQM66845.1 hypothetical protein ASE65_01835 [Sphingomonas sp. Leaf16]KQN17793.1 hypothetical protein ASE81_01215 [Sphingomonas sp. Leaf29]KQN23655.1 hypothetical protein ASE83_04095 [Sphingomonas sp. Leaf32]
MKRTPLATAAISLCIVACSPVSASQGGPVSVTATADSAPVAYARLARLGLESDIVLDATIRSIARIAPDEAPGLAPGHVRFYVTADVGALIRANGPLPARIGYLVDVPFDPRGRAPNLKRQRVIAFARAVAGRPDQVQLVTPDAQFAWAPALDQRVRDVVREVIAPDAPPAITGIGNAFHVPGTLPGEGETQIFLQTTTGAPVSLLVLRRPGEERRWALSLGDIIDEAGGAPKPDTLAWYRLTCGLPAELPEPSLQSQEAGNATIAREDFAFVRESLGRCDDGRSG